MSELDKPPIFGRLVRSSVGNGISGAFFGLRPEVPMSLSSSVLTLTLKED